MRKSATYANMMPSAASTCDACFAASCALIIAMMGTISLVSVILLIGVLLVSVFLVISRIHKNTKPVIA